MASNYASPRVPTVPQSTPASIRAKLHAPIHNPYDKFTRTEFDAWIGDLTTKIRRVLAHEEPIVRRFGPPGGVGDNSGFDDEEVAEDSFAEVKARRAAKGKERADINYSEEEEEEEFVESIIFPPEDDAEEEEDIRQNEQEPSWGIYDNDIEEVRHDPQNAIEISSNEDERPTAHESSVSTYGERPRSIPEEDKQEHNQAHPRDIESSEDEIQPESEAADDFLPREGKVPPVDIPDPWVGPSTYAEDFYSGGDIPESALRTGDPHLLPTEEFEDDIDQLEEDFPPFSTPGQPTELADPWSGPRMYAEDFYSGGDIRGDPSTLTPSHLTPMALTPHDDEDIGMVLTPGVASPTPSAESPPAVYDIGEHEQAHHTEDHEADSMIDQLGDVSEAVPTFSMPSTKDDEHAEVESRDSTTINEAIPAEALHADPVGQASIPGPSNEGIPADTSPDQNLVFHERSASPPRTSIAGHVDWNSPPAFPIGHAASSVGHLRTPPEVTHASMPTDKDTPEILEISDDEDETVAPAAEASASHQPSRASRIDIGDRDTTTIEEVAFSQIAMPENPASPKQSSPPPTTHEAIFNTTSGEQVDYDYGEFESLYMADEFHALAPIEPVADTTGPDQDKKEPVYAQDADFGLLDTTGREILSPESEFLKVLRAFDDGHPVESPNDHQSTVIPDVPDIRVDTVTSDSVEIAESSPETENPRDIQPDSSEAQEAAAPDVALSVYEVVEVDEGDDEGDKIKAVQEVDVETDFGDGSVLDLDYVVEEAVTEGRRTMEPEDEDKDATQKTHSASDVEPSMDISDSIGVGETGEPQTRVASSVSGPEAPNPIPDETVKEEAETSTTTENKPIESDISPRAHSLDPAEQPASSNSLPAIHISVITHENESPIISSAGSSRHVEEISTTSGLVHDDHTVSTFETGVPMPVSADPSVPDPASIHSTPNSPGSPASVAEGPAVDQVAESEKRPIISSAIPPSLFKHLSGHKSISGLFTPLSEGGSSPTDSAHSSAQSDDGSAPEQIVPDGVDTNDGANNATDATIVVQGPSEPTTPRGDSASPEAGGSQHAEVDNHPVEITTLPHSSSPPVLLAESTQPHKIADAVGIDQDADGDIDSEYSPSTDIQSSRGSRSPPPPHVDEDPKPSRSEDKVVPVATSDSLAQPTANQSLNTGDNEAERLTFQDESLPASKTALQVADSGLAETEKSTVPAETEEDAPAETRVPTIGEATDQASVGKRDSYNKSTAAADSSKSQEHPPEPRSEAGSPNVLPEGEKDVPAKESRPRKRKRTQPVLPPPRKTRSMAAREREATVEPAVEHSSESKGKQRAEPHPPDDDAVSVAFTSASDDATSTNLDTISEAPDLDSSRASSIVSSVPGNSSDIFPHAGPNIVGEPSNGFQSSLPLLHAYGVLHHHHGRPQPQNVPATEQQHLALPQPSVPKRDTEKTPSEASSSAGVSPASSPVTRSNCRFHKISLPREENGPRVFFVVPGCSLSDQELMQEEQIEDHGDVTADDNGFLIPDIEALGLSSYLLGILRQLVGVDLIREQEIFYLAQPDEESRFKVKKKAHHRARESISSRNTFVASPRLSQKFSKARRKGTTPNSDSISTAGSVRRARRSARRDVSASASISDDDDDDEETELKPKAKRRRASSSASPDLSPVSPADETSVVPVASPPAASDDQPSVIAHAEDAANASSSASVVEKPRLRRTKRLGVDAAAYKPEPSGGSDTDDGIAAISKRKRATRNRKRARADDGELEDPEDVKKRKLTSNESGSAEETSQKPLDREPAAGEE